MKLFRPLLALLAISSSSAQTIQFYGVEKRITHQQTSSSAPSSASNTIHDPNGPYFFGGTVSGSNLNSLGSAPTLSGSFSGSPLTLVLKSNSEYGFQGSNPAVRGFGTAGGLDAAFPNLTYTLGNLPGSVALVLGVSDAYPTDIPHITTSNSWSGGSFQVNAATGVTLNFSNFSTYGTGLGGFIQFSLYTTSGGNIGTELASVSTLFPLSNSAQTSYVINPGVLTAGQTYFGELSYGTFTTFDNTSISGANGYALFTNVTGFSITAVPEPSTYAALAGLGVLGIAAHRRRCRISG